MKTASTIARYLLGLLFTVFGLNGFLHFIPMPPQEGVAGQFMGAMFVSNYLIPIFALQLAGGVLLLAGRFVPAALSILGPIIVNILLYHMTMDPAGLPMAIVTAALWATVFYRERDAFKSVFITRSAT